MKELFKQENLINKDKILSVLLMTFIFTTGSFINVFADGEYGKNASDWVKEQAFWVALLIIAVVCIKYLVKKAWSQFAGFAVLGAIVLVIIDDPVKLKTVGATIWTKIFGG